MKRSLFVLFACTVLVWGHPDAANCDFPSEPIQLIVYTKPGGAIDAFSRKFVEVASSHTDAAFQIVHKPGGGGLAAMLNLLASDADGYKFMAATRSIISKLASNGGSIRIDNFRWLVMLVSDPEAVITNPETGPDSWEELVRDAAGGKEPQIWAGPAVGGIDHITAHKIWKATGIKAKWLPYSSGGEAMAALARGHAAAYVGNPQDVLGKPELKVVAVSSPIRLPEPFDRVPTFKELGVQGLSGEFMWRGFIINSNVPTEAVVFLNSLVREVANDERWIQFVEGGGARPVFIEEPEFTKLVEKDLADFQKTVPDAGQ